MTGEARKMNRLYRAIVGIVLVFVAVIVDVAAGYEESYNGIVTIILTAGLLSLVNTAFTKNYNGVVQYVIYMASNIGGLLLYLLVLSYNEVIGSLYTCLFAILVFVAMWIVQMSIVKSDTPVKRILTSLLVNVIVLLVTAFAAFAVVTVSVILIG